MSAKSKFIDTRDIFYNDLAEAFAVGESLHTFLARRRDFLIEHEHTALAGIYSDMIDRMDESGALSHVVGPIMPVNDLMSLRSVDSGLNDESRSRMLVSLAYAVKRKREMKKVLWKAVIGPLIALPIVTMLPLITSFQITVMEELLPPTEWGTFGIIFYWLCYFIRTYCIGIGIAMVCLFALFVWSFENWNNAARSWFDKYPPYSVYRDLSAAGFLGAMAEFMSIKKPLVESLQELMDGASSWMSVRIEQTLENLDERPGDYGNAFNTSMLSPELQLRLATYAERGNASANSSNDAFAEGMMKLGTDGLSHVVDSVEKNAIWLGVGSTVLTVLVILIFSGGNLLVSSTVSDKITQQSEANGR